MLTRIRYFDDGSHSAQSYEDFTWPSVCIDDPARETVGIQVWLVDPFNWDRVLLFSEGETYGSVYNPEL
jgi:hypothetical protein